MIRLTELSPIIFSMSIKFQIPFKCSSSKLVKDFAFEKIASHPSSLIVLPFLFIICFTV